MNTIYDGTFVLGNTSATTYQAGNGISITQPSEGTVRISNDETVLWSGYTTTTGAIQLNESVRNFETVECYGDAGNGWSDHARPQIYGKAELGYHNSGAAIFTLMGMTRVSNGTVQIRCMPIDLNQTTATLNQAFQLNISTAAAITRENTTAALTRIIGINRISGGNA